MSVPATASERLRVEQAMHAGVISCGRETPLSDVAQLMAQNRVHASVGLEGEDDDLGGVVSHPDLAAAAGVRELREQSAGASAATPALMVSPRESLRRAAQMMTEHATAHLVVVDPDSGRPVGVLSTLDVARALGHHDEEER